MKMSPGDSLSMIAMARDIMGPQTPPGIQAEDNIKMGIRLLSTQTEEEFKAERLKASEERIGKENQTIEAYAAEQGLELQKTESGIYYVITKEGTGQQAMAGDVVHVDYTGTTLDGNVFDSSINDPNRPPIQLCTWAVAL